MFRLIYIQLYVSKHFRHYLRQLETWLSFICATLSLVTSIAGEIAKCSMEEIESRHCAHWVLHSISIAILLSWMQMMLLIGRVPMWGYYALMFSTVLKNILKVASAIPFIFRGIAATIRFIFFAKNLHQKLSCFSSKVIAQAYLYILK